MSPTPFSSPPDKDKKGRDKVGDNPAGFVKDIFLSFLGDFFADEPKGKFRFTGNDRAETELEITDITSYKKEIVERRPALIVQRGAFSWARLGLDQLQTLLLRDGIRRHRDLMSGTVTIHAIAREGLEAERLAAQVFYALKFHRRELQRRGLFDAGQEAQLGPESPPNAFLGGDVDSHTVDVPVFVPCYVQVGWESRPAKDIPFRSVDITLQPTRIRKSGLGGTKIVDLDGVSQETRIVSDS